MPKVNMSDSEVNIDNLRVRLATYSHEYRCGMEGWALRCCQLAMDATDKGNYGVGALLISREGDILAESGNQVFSAGFNSSAHAEMCVIDEFERTYPNYSSRSGLMLLTSLEPCPMCCTRILAAGIGRVRYLATDKDGGMMSHCDKLPYAWKNLSELIDIQEVNGLPELSKLASDIASANISLLRKKLLGIIRP
ncbi:nucleoside deaminase [Neptuniibacter sp. QD34_54]|uniref:nucleoside deaminase n=1 Tax=Neptuniibacter sp. QD34_54 TaxID=3398208 RepID=UPI0039F48A55